VSTFCFGDIVIRILIRAFVVSGALALLTARAVADGAPTDRPEDGARARAGERKSEAIKGERRQDEPDDADAALQKKSKAGEKHAEPSAD
jgi:hypothetical protein